MHFGCVDPGGVPFARLDAQGVPKGYFYTNSLDSIAADFATLRERNLGLQLAIFEPHYLRIVLAFHAAGKLPEGAVLNFYFSGAHGVFGPNSMPGWLSSNAMSIGRPLLCSVLRRRLLAVVGHESSGNFLAGAVT